MEHEIQLAALKVCPGAKTQKPVVVGDCKTWYNISFIAWSLPLTFASQTAIAVVVVVVSVLVPKMTTS